MKPGFLISYYSSLDKVGGIATAVRTLLRQIARSGEYTPIYLQNDWDARRARVVLPPGEFDTLQFLLRSPVVGQWNFRGLTGFLLHFPATIWTLWRVCRECKIAAVNIQNPDLSALSLAFLKWSGLHSLRLSFTFQGLKAAQEPVESAGLKRWLWSCLFSQADGVIAVSEWLKNEVLLKGMPELEPKAYCVYNGVDVGSMDQILLDRNRPQQTAVYRIVNLAGFAHHKGQDILLRAYQIFRQSCPDSHLVMAGTAAAGLEEIADLKEKLGLDDHVTMKLDSPHYEAIQLLSQADLSILCSRREPQGIAVVEAGALGIPVIVTSVGGLVEMVSDGVNGLVVPPEDPEALAAATLELYRNPARAQRMAEQMRQDVAKRFSATVMYRYYLRVLRLPI